MANPTAIVANQIATVATCTGVEGEAATVAQMSRKHSSSFNIGGLRESSVERSPSRSPARKIKRNRKKKEDEGVDATDHPMLMIQEESESDPQSIYEKEVREGTLYQIEHEETTYFLLKQCDLATGNVIRDKRKMGFVLIQRADLAMPIYLCSCDSTLRETFTSLDDRASTHYGELKSMECIHSTTIRALTEDILFQDITVISDGITPICDSPRLFITLPGEEQPGVVRLNQKRLTCLVCRKETCAHVKEMAESPHLDNYQCEEEEEGEQGVPIEWIDKSYSFCPHNEPLHSRVREVNWVDGKGIQSRKEATFLSSSCCRYVLAESICFALSEMMLISIDLLRLYECLLAKNATTLSGYWKTLVDFAQNYGTQLDRVISLSSLSRAWNEYLRRLHIPKDKFGCDTCGIYPSALIFDGIQMGLRANISMEHGLTHGICTFREYPLPYIGKLQERKEMRRFLDGESPLPDIQWPSPITCLLEEATTGNCVLPKYKSFLKLIFGNSPIPLLLQAGVQTEARHVLDRLLDGSLEWSDEETNLLRVLPTLYSSLKPLLNSTRLPTVVIDVLRYIVTQADSLLTQPPHIEHYYGPPKETHLEYFPMWPLQRGLTSYTKDKPREKQLECSEKVIGENRRLTPGLLLVSCPHRRPYGFRIMKTPESSRDIFQVLLTRLGDNPPSTVIYDNACMLAAYTLAREPVRFRDVRFLIDRFHHFNHRACSQALRIRSYQADPILSAYNTQSCEQLNSLLRHLGNSLPFMSLQRYTKTLILFLSRN